MWILTCSGDGHSTTSTATPHVTAKSRKLMFSRAVFKGNSRVNLSSLATRQRFATLSQSGYDLTLKNLRINKETRVLCQGLTGKQVFHSINSREHFIQHKLLNMVPRWWEVSRQARLARSILACQFSRQPKM